MCRTTIQQFCLAGCKAKEVCYGKTTGEGGQGPLRTAEGREAGVGEARIEESAGEPDPGELNLTASKLKLGSKAKVGTHGNPRAYLLSQHKQYSRDALRV